MKVGLDVDGVLANFYLQFCRKYDYKYEVIHEWQLPNIVKKWNEIAKNEEFWETLPVMSPPESITFDFDYYITSIPEYLKGSRENWLSKNGFPDKPVIVSHDKAKTCKKLGVGILIDDKPKSVYGSDIYHIQFLPDYWDGTTIYSDITIRHLSSAENIIKSLNHGK